MIPSLPHAPRTLRSVWLDARNRLTPPRLLVISFLLLTIFGTLGLKLLPGLYTGAPLGWTDALFTATSAVCVTGLIVVDTATYFTGFGQVYLLVLIQLGGLGIITFTTLVILALGRKLSLYHEAVSSSVAEVIPEIDFRHLTRNVVRFTFLFEIAGALALYLLWIPRLGWAGAAWPALFHSVSAFCNAGFSVFTDSLVGFASAPASLGVIMVLIVVGGIGFLTMEELYVWRKAVREGRRYRTSLHSRIVVVTTIALVVGGWALFALFEWTVTLRGMGLGDKLTNALFMSVTARTAGFNTVSYEATSAASDFLTILLMSIGGSPGSTAGGMKTTTFAVIGMLAISRLRGLRIATVGHRSIPEETVQRAVGLFAVAFGVITAAIFGLTVTEVGFVSHGATEGEFLHVFFEAVSAFNTVGLSMGATSSLSTPGKLLVIALMYLGRVGPLTFAAALVLRRSRVRRSFRYAYEEVVIG